MAIGLQTLAALVLRHLQSTFLLKITHRFCYSCFLEKSANLILASVSVKKNLAILLARPRSL